MPLRWVRPEGRPYGAFMILVKATEASKAPLFR